MQNKCVKCCIWICMAFCAAYMAVILAWEIGFYIYAKNSPPSVNMHEIIQLHRPPINRRVFAAKRYNLSIFSEIEVGVTTRLEVESILGKTKLTSGSGIFWYIYLLKEHGCYVQIRYASGIVCEMDIVDQNGYRYNREDWS